MGTRWVIVPNELAVAITAEVDRFLALHPKRENERANMEADLLAAFDRFGNELAVAITAEVDRFLALHPKVVATITPQATPSE